MSGYVGRGINYGNAATDHFTGNGGATYTLNYDTTTDGVIVSLDGVVQKNGTDFNVTSGTSLVFTSVVASPIAIQVVYTGLTLALGSPADGTVTDAKITAMSASKLTGALPAISGASLTNLPIDPTRNFIIDGDFTQWPEGTGATTAVHNNYGPALWDTGFSHDGAVTWERSTDVPTVSASNHQSKYSLLYKCTSTDTSIASYQNFRTRYYVTGSDFTALHQQTVTLSFWCKTASANSGHTYYFNLHNSATNRSYVQSFTPTSTWTKFTYTIDLDTSGTWLFTEADIGLEVSFHLVSGTDYDNGTIGSWVGTGSEFWASGTPISNFLDSTSNEIYFSQVGLYLGSSAPDSFVSEPISTVKDQVEYYVQKLLGGTANQWGYNGSCASSTLAYVFLNFHRTMRKAPTVSFKGTNSNFNVFNNNTNDNCSADPVFDTVGLDTCRCTLTVASGLNISDAASIRVDTTSDYILADARH